MNFNFDNIYDNSYSINDIMNDNNFLKYNSFPNYINYNNNHNNNFYDNNNCFYMTDPNNFLNYNNNNYLNYNSYDLNNNSNNFYSYNNNNNLIENQFENNNNYNNNFIPSSNEFSSFSNINNFPKNSQEFFESETYDNSNNNNNNNSPLINIQINNEFIIKKSEILLPKLETFFSLISSKLLSNEEISIKIIDLENSSKFNFKEGFYLLPEDSSEFRYITYNLYNNSTKIARLLKLSSIIYRKIKTLSSSTKRELYYNNVEIFKSVDVTDSIISDLCSILVINKFELPIFPSAKGLFCGNILIKNEFGQELNIKSYNIFNKINLITYEYLIFDLKIEYENEIKFILIVEKETLFFNLLENNYFKNIFPNCLIITGKGYPDFITKVFIKKIFNKLKNVPKFYFGDNDPHGLNIYLNYLFGSKNSSRENEFMNISDLKWIGLNNEMVNNIKYLDVHEKNFNEKEENLNDINNNILNGMIKLDEKDIEKLNKIKNLDIFNLNNWIECKNIHKNNLIENVSVILYEIELMLNFGYKTEGEFLISKYCNMFIENLNVHITNFYNNLNNINNNNNNLLNNITNI